MCEPNNFYFEIFLTFWFDTEKALFQVILGLLLVYADWEKRGACLRVCMCMWFMTYNYWDMFFIVRSNDSFNFPLGLIKYIVIVCGEPCQCVPVCVVLCCVCAGLCQVCVCQCCVYVFCCCWFVCVWCCVRVCGVWSVVCACACVCVRERERERTLFHFACRHKLHMWQMSIIILLFKYGLQAILVSKCLGVTLYWWAYTVLHLGKQWEKFFTSVCVDPVWHPFHPQVTAVARKWSLSFCQMCR